MHRPTNSYCQVLIACAVAVLAPACDFGQRPRHSAVLITLGTSIPDPLPPRLATLAGESVRYEEARSVAPVTLPAHATFMTGLYPPRHGVRMDGRALPATAATLAEWASDAETQTAAFVGSLTVGPAFGLAQGFGVYTAPRPAIRGHAREPATRSPKEVVADAIAWLRERNRRETFFLWVHLAGESVPVDAALGPLLASLKAEDAWNGTAVLVVADHGRGTGGLYGRDDGLRVPLILKRPDGLHAGDRRSELVSAVVVFPTLADALGFHVHEMDVDGVSLLGDRRPTKRGLYFEAHYGYIEYGWSPLAGWVDERGKYLHSSAPEFFDLANDPGEATNRLVEFDDIVEEYVAAIEEVVARSSLSVDGRTALEIPLASDVPGLPSPADRKDEHARMLAAQTAFEEGRYAEAEETYLKIIARNAGNNLAQERLGMCRIRQRRRLEAIEPLERVMASGAASADGIVELGYCLRSAGRLERATQCCERALALDRDHVLALRLIVDLLERQERGDEAVPYLERYELLTRTPFPR